jgi:hypothetical protein
MGFFSYECRGCGQSIKSPYNVPRDLRYQNQTVRLLPDESRVGGKYDGYGRIHTKEGEIVDTIDDPQRGSTEEDPPKGRRIDHLKVGEWWHARCFSEAGEPEYSGPSPSAYDQGFFYEKTGEVSDV